MKHYRGADRAEVQLLPASVEDYVDGNAPARFIDAFVEGLDFEKLKFARALPAATGRPAYHPADLLKLYVYGYLNRIRSSRRLEAEAGRNLEVMWLLRGVSPDFKTIADFRKENCAAFKAVFKQFNLLCRKLDLFGAELVAIDGSKFKASNNPRRHFTQEQLHELIAKIEGRIDAYLQELDQQDKEAEGAPGRPNGQALQEKIAQLKERKGNYDELLGELKTTGQKEVSLVDADSRGMQKVGVGYNVQVAVDAKHHLIVEPEVVQSACDRGQLSQMAKAAKEAMGVEKLQAVADAGYHEADQLQACEQSGIETYVPDTGKTSGQSKNGKEVFPKERFIYDTANDKYCCPAGQILHPGNPSKCKGKERIIYRNYTACRSCALKAQCTASAYRTICRRVNEAVVDRQAARLAAHPEIMALRKTIVEHVFGTLRNWNHDTFLTRGLKKVRGEFSLSALAYNLRRTLNLKKMEELLATLLQFRSKTALSVI
jgi:transposase